MRLPWGKFKRIGTAFLLDQSFVVLGCLSFEDRTLGITRLCNEQPESTFRCAHLFKAVIPENTFPDHSLEISKKIENIKTIMNDQHYRYNLLDDQPLVATFDHLLDLNRQFKEKAREDNINTVVLDISTMPKRFFCFLMKKYLAEPFPQNLIIAYTQPESYAPEDEPLAEDAEACENLPGFCSSEDKSDRMVVSVGLEEFNLQSLLETHPATSMKVLMSFPPDGDLTRRQWRVLRRIAGDNPSSDFIHDIEVVPALDVEQAYATLCYWENDSSGIVLAPFGPKTHSVAMVLFALQHDRSICYIQPKSYNPNYSQGISESWAYVVKWSGETCFNRCIYQV